MAGLVGGLLRAHPAAHRHPRRSRRVAVRWQPGDVVVWRETWRGQTYFAWPVRVVADGPDEIAVYVAPGGWTPDPSWPVPEIPNGWEA